MKEIILKGSFYEMGVQYGKACTKEIKSFAKMAYVMASLSKKPGSQPFNPNMWHIIPTFFTYKKEKSKWQKLALEHERFVKKYHPDAIDCMQGIAEGTGLPYIDILSLNISTENILTCSIFGACGTSTKTNEPFIAMNADEEPMTQKYEVFLDFQPDQGFKYKVTALAGTLLYNHGMNEKGLALASTLLFLRSPKKKESRVPMMVLMEVLNTCSTVEEVKEFFESVPNHSVGSVFYVADSEKFMRVECCVEGRKYEIIENGIKGNTNLATTDVVTPFDAIPFLKQTFNAKSRAKRMNELLEKYDGKIDQKIMHAIASDHGEKGTDTFGKSICQHPKFLSYNFKTLVSFGAQPKEKCFWIYEGNPCKNKMKRYQFT